MFQPIKMLRASHVGFVCLLLHVLASLTDGLKMDKLVEQALAKYDKNVVLRPNQLDCLNLLARERNDVIVNLPEGYGKSLIPSKMSLTFSKNDSFTST
jgi:superfamily II DNA helicase RecQ